MSERKPKPPGDFPDIHIVEVKRDEDGRQTAHVVSSPICDFCGDQNPSWDYGCEDFQLPGIPSPFVGGSYWASQSGWVVCNECARLIDNRYLGDLSRRMFEIGVPIKWSGQIIQGFFDHMTGEKEPFG